MKAKHRPSLLFLVILISTTSLLISCGETTGGASSEDLCLEDCDDAQTDLLEDADLDSSSSGDSKDSDDDASVDDASNDDSSLTSTCGNAILEGDERCDDGNAQAGDGCSELCALEPGYVCAVVGVACGPATLCGDAKRDPNEACDNGINDGAYGGCNPDCSLAPACGDGQIDGSYGEQCDDGNTDDCVGSCLGDCSEAVFISGCGDGVICGTEVCDDGSDNGGGACLGDCSGVQVCGDGILNGNEACDDGDTLDGNGCPSDCSVIEVGYDCPESATGQPLAGPCTFVGGTSIKLNVSFQYDPQPTPNDPALLHSITIDENVFDLFVVPTGYEMTQVGWNGHSANSIYENGNRVAHGSDAPTWNAMALSAFQDYNLNHYFEASTNGRDICGNYEAVASTDAQRQSLLYEPAIPANAGGVVAITERNVNNCYHIAVYGVAPEGGPQELLGQTFVQAGPAQSGPTYAPPSGDSDYWASGRVVENNGTIGIALFPLSDLAPLGYDIQRVELTASTTDHGDGKFFILQTYARNEVEFVTPGVPFNGDAGKNDNVPQGSTYSLVTNVQQGSLQLNADGTYTYTSVAEFTGSDVFTYQVCLPPPNATICDQATVTFYPFMN